MKEHENITAPKKDFDALLLCQVHNHQAAETRLPQRLSHPTRRADDHHRPRGPKMSAAPASWRRVIAQLRVIGRQHGRALSRHGAADRRRPPPV
jgi:hypothetical protein